MSRRRRVELAEIASLDAEIACARRQCEDQMQQACEKLMRRRAEGGSVHNLYLETLRPCYVDLVADGSTWPVVQLQAFLSRHFAVYREREAFESLCTALQQAGARWNDAAGSQNVEIESFDVLKDALRRDTATRMVILDAFALEASISSYQATMGAEEEEVKLPRLAVHGKRQVPGHPTTSIPVPIDNAIKASEWETSLLWCDEDHEEYSVPINSMLIPVEFSVEVVKKSQNWLGRWRTRHLHLRWNELEVRKKNGATSSRHGAARSFPSHLGSSSSGIVHARASVASVQSPTTSVKSKRYALHDLISVQLIQLNESDPSRKQAIDIHFKQTAVSGHGYTTKSLILSSDKGVDILKKTMTLISTLALFRGLVAGEKPQQLMRFIQSGANVNAFCAIPTQQSFGPMSALQLILVQSSNKPDKSHDIAIMRMLLDANADSRAFLHWHFARRPMVSINDRVGASVVELLLPTGETTLPALQVPLTIFGSDGHGWTLLMYLCLLSDNVRVNILLNRIRTELRETDKLLRYIEHINGNGDTALHIAIKGSGYQCKIAGSNEDAALAIATCCLVDDIPTSSTTSLFYISDANGQTVMHLSIKAKMWRLVELLLRHRLFDICTRDDFGNNSLHLLIKLGAPTKIIESMVRHVKNQPPCDATDENLDSHDQTLDASPLMLAVLRRREDYVQILLEGGASTEISSADDGKDSSELLDAAIRRRMPSAAKGILKYTNERTPVNSTILALAIRFGLYSLAHEIIHRPYSDVPVDDSTTRWRDAESGYPVVMLAAIANQLELVAIVVDKAGPSSFAWEYSISRETLLHTLVLMIEHAVQDAKDPHCSKRPVLTTSTSEGSLLGMNGKVYGAVESFSASPTVCSAFTMLSIEQLISQALVSLSSLDILTSVCERIVEAKFQRASHGILNSSLEASALQRHAPYTLLNAVSVSSRESTSRLLPILLAASRVRSIPPATLITAHNGYLGETSIFVALRYGYFDKALLLLHHLLHDNANEQVTECGGDLWMETPETTLVHLVCQHPNDTTALMIIDILLRMDACTVILNKEGWCPLHIAIRHGCDARIIQVFKKYEQDLNVWSDVNYSLQISERIANIPLTPLMVAVQYNNVMAFRELVRCGAECRLTTPTYRVGVLQFAARCLSTSSEMIGEVLKLTPLQKGISRHVDGMLGADAADILSKRLEERGAPTTNLVDVVSSQSSCRCEDGGEPVEKDFGEPPSDNSILRITLLGLQTPEPIKSADILPPTPPSNTGHIVNVTPPPSPSRSLSDEDSAQRRLEVPRKGHSRESSRELSDIVPAPRHPVLDDSTLEFLRDEEKATLTLIAQQAQTEAQEWLKKRSGKRKLLSEARAQLQANHGHRRAGSGQIVISDDMASPVNDAELLDMYKALAEKEFVDKHVARTVSDARAVIEREKRAIYEETGVFPGEMILSNKPKDSSVGSNSVSSARGASRKLRPASISGAMTLLSSKSMDLPDPESDRGVPWWSEHGTTSFDDDDSTSPGEGRMVGTWLSSTSSGQASRKEENEEVINPLDCEDFVHLIEKRKSIH